MKAGRQCPAYFIYHWLWCALDWLYPPTCAGCGQLGERWCSDCQAAHGISEAVCPRCGNWQQDDSLCPSCQIEPPCFTCLRSWGPHEGVLRKAIHQLKYQGNIGLGEALSKHLITYYNLLRWDIDWVVPVPLSPARQKERGYNQAGVLARPLSYAIGKPYHTGELMRARETATQVGLNAKERKLNVQDAFQADPIRVKGKKILVIDDVTTTGSTINACAQALTQAGASAVYGLTLSRAILQADADDHPTTSHT